MNIWTLKIDPDTGYVEIESQPEYRQFRSETYTDYIMHSGRKISKTSEFTKIFDTKEDATEFRISSLKKMRAEYTEVLKKVRAYIHEESPYSPGRPKSFVEVINPDGDKQTVTIIRAMEITGLSREAVYINKRLGRESNKGFVIRSIA